MRGARTPQNLKNNVWHIRAVILREKFPGGVPPGHVIH